MNLALWLSLFLATSGLLASARGENVRLGPVFGFVEENDLVVDTDRHYTQGLKLSYLHAEERRLGWTASLLDAIPAPRLSVEARRWGLAVGQNIYTPGDILTPTLLINDRPYGGWLYGGFLLQRRGATPGGLPAWDHLELDLGVIGPESLAEDAQNWVHQMRGFDLAQGWAHELNTEPAVALKLSRHWLKRWESQGWGLDVIPHSGLALGNVSTAFHLGATLRAGYNLPLDYGYQTVDALAAPSGGLSGGETWRDCGFYLFAGADGRAVAYSAFLDGNLFHDSHHVNKRPVGADLKGGAVFWWKRLEVAYALVLRTKEFAGQSERNAFGSLSAKWKF